MIKVCEFCQKEFEVYNDKRIFCSQSCSAKWNRVLWNKTKIKCEICGREISRACYSKHLNVHKGIKNKCVKTKIKCEICKKEVYKSGYNRHHKCCLRDKNNPKKITLKKVWEQKNGLYKCPYCEKEYVKKGICTHIYLNHTEHGKIVNLNGIKKYNQDVKEGKIIHPLKGRHLSEEHIQHLKYTFKRKKAEGYIPAFVTYIQSEKGKKEQRERKIELYEKYPEKHPNRKLSNNRKQMSYPEKVCYDWLTKNNIKFEHQKHIGKYWVDFFVLNKNIVIEIDGEYWHKNENNERTQYIEKYYSIIRIKAKENIEQTLKSFLT